MIIQNRLEKFASQVGYFSEMQFGFQEGSGCIEASLVSQYLKPIIICWPAGVARCLVVSLTSGKLLMQFGLMG